jgi:hypothetical protein
MVWLGLRVNVMTPRKITIHDPTVIRGIPLDQQTQMGCYGTIPQVLTQQGYNLGKGFWDRQRHSFLPCSARTDLAEQDQCKTSTSILSDGVNLGE